MNNNPHTAPPALPPRPWSVADNAGVKHGLQASETWGVGEHDGRDICDQRLAHGMWRLSVFGSEHILLDVQFGTSKSRQFRNLRAPLVLYVPGQLTVSARPSPTDSGFYPGSEVMCTCTPVSSGHGCDARFLRTTPGALPIDAARFRALAASVVRITDVGTIVDVPLAVGAVLPLIAGSSLISGAGYVEFET